MSISQTTTSESDGEIRINKSSDDQLSHSNFEIGDESTEEKYTNSSSSQSDSIDGLDIEDNESKEDDEALKAKESPRELEAPKYLKFLCAYLGATAFMGYTACINAIDYFNEKCPGHPELSQNVARILNFCATGAQIICFPFVEKIGANIRILVSQLVFAFCFLFFLVYTNIATPVSVGALYAVMAFDGIFFGILMTSTNGFCGLLAIWGAPFAIIGNALAGIFSTALRLISKPIGSKGEGWFYFGVCFAIIVVGEILLFCFTYTDYYKERMKYAKKGLPFKTRILNIGRIFKKAYLECIQAAVINMTAYIVFPGYATSTQIKHGLDRGWVTSIIIACYMIGDFVGRSAARWWKWPSRNYVWIGVVLRFLFFPLYCISIENVVEKLADEIWIMVLSFFLPFSGGYFLNLSQAYTSSNPKLEKGEQEIASFTVSFCIGIGTFIGCLISYAMPVREGSGH
ncbi:hypothetical protein TRFO_16282 [Tritrichomonas foetus]|uniref:Nucleoside transporter family protein n=1 Tax=Tritrichomonas foetus TaxID=1144522 RepID=A0A1J4KQE1_9EUKA|nr:hypothetical protein TRFO_16282 [Tritrichomonas foetus]|eukprot:OHT13521.1 hypothetical protein TRFO_16282 [Tritrichomonas foetus]